MPPAEVLNGFRFVNLLMTGQTSQVWQVERESDHRTFALKLLLPEAIRQPIHRQFLAHEAKVGMQLEQKNTIKIWQYFPDRDNPHFIMEYFPSVNLKLRICYKQPIVREKFKNIVDQVAAALGWMHERKWVHKDVKPDNVLLNNAGDVRLIDFALAERILPSWRRRFAGKRKVMGTRSYMSPEQIRGKPLDARSDIYSFGVVLFEMCAGRVPLVGENPTQLLHKHLIEQPPPPSAYNPKVSRDMDELVLKMLEKKPEDRPADMYEFMSQFKSVTVFEE